MVRRRGSKRKDVRDKASYLKRGSQGLSSTARATAPRPLSGSYVTLHVTRPTFNLASEAVTGWELFQLMGRFHWLSFLPRFQTLQIPVVTGSRAEHSTKDTSSSRFEALR